VIQTQLRRIQETEVELWKMRSECVYSLVQVK